MKARSTGAKRDSEATEIEFYDEDGNVNLEVWWKLMGQAARPYQPLPTPRDIPEELAEAMGAIRGLSEAVEFTKMMLDPDDHRKVGLGVAEDLIAAIGTKAAIAQCRRNAETRRSLRRLIALAGMLSAPS
jgi:hypothetical protein